MKISRKWLKTTKNCPKRPENACPRDVPNAPGAGMLMPKMKSNSGARKRFKVTASGKLARKKAYKSHILTKKSAKRKRGLRESTLVDKTDTPRMQRLIQS